MHFRLFSLLGDILVFFFLNISKHIFLSTNKHKREISIWKRSSEKKRVSHNYKWDSFIFSLPFILSSFAQFSMYSNSSRSNRHPKGNSNERNMKKFFFFSTKLTQHHLYISSICQTIPTRPVYFFLSFNSLFVLRFTPLFSY